MLDIDGLIAIKSFCREVGMLPTLFSKYHHAGRIDGLIRVADRFYVNRKTVQIYPYQKGWKFIMWLELGGRNGPVSVPDELKKRGIKKLTSKNNSLSLPITPVQSVASEPIVSVEKIMKDINAGSD